MGTWIVEVDGIHITVRTPNEEISRIAGSVTFTSDHACGAWCCDDTLVPSDRLERAGEAIVKRLRGISPNARIVISREQFVLHLESEAKVGDVCVAIGELEAEHSRPRLSIAS